MSTTKLHRAIQCIALCLAVTSLASGADRGGREPSQRAGTWAVGGDLGLGNATGDNDFDTEPILGGYAEYFPTNNLSWRGMIQLVQLDRDMSGPVPGGGDADIVILGGNALYHWEGRQASPFVTGGLGIYDYDTESGAGDGAEPGFNLGGGVDIFMTPVVGLKLEGLVHVTAQDEGPDSFVIGTGGVRFAF